MPAMQAQNAPQTGRMEAMQPMRNISDGIVAAHTDAGATSVHPGAGDHLPSAETSTEVGGGLAEQRLPCFYTGISVTIDQIDDDVRVELPAILRRLVTAHRAKDVVAMKLAAEAMAKFTGGMQGVANSVVRSSLGHINRRARP